MTDLLTKQISDIVDNYKLVSKQINAGIMHLKRSSYELFLLLAIAFWVTSATGLQPYIEWSRTFGGPYDDGALSLQKTEDSGYIIAGYTSSRGEGSDLWLMKTDSGGSKSGTEPLAERKKMWVTSSNRPETEAILLRAAPGHMVSARSAYGS